MPKPLVAHVSAMPSFQPVRSSRVNDAIFEHEWKAGRE